MENQKHRIISAPIAIMAIVVLIAVAVYVGYLVYQNKQTDVGTKNTSVNNPVSNSTNNTSTNSADTSSNETTNLKTYTNSQYGFSFKYLSNWEINSTPSTAEDLITIQKIGSKDDATGLQSIGLKIEISVEYEKAVDYFNYPSWPFKNSTIQTLSGEADYWSGSSASTLHDSAFIKMDNNQYVQLFALTEAGGSGYTRAHNEKVRVLKSILSTFKFTS